MLSNEFRRRLVCESNASDELLAGARMLGRAFSESPSLSAARDNAIVRADSADPPCMLLVRGVAFRSSALPDGRRSIREIVLPTDIIGTDHAVLGRPNSDVVAASALGYRLLTAERVRELMHDHRVALWVLALAGEARLRSDLHIMALTRLDARGRVAGMILGIYERLRRQALISRPTFNLPLTQDQIADHLGITVVHVSRTLRRLREERVVLVDRQVVIILDLDALRRAAADRCQAPASPSLHPEPSRQAAIAGA